MVPPRNYKNLLNSDGFKLSIKKGILEAEIVKLIDNELNEYSFEIAQLNLKTDEVVGKDLLIKFNKKYFRNDNDPRLRANAVIIDKENARFKKGVFTTCKKRKE